MEKDVGKDGRVRGLLMTRAEFKRMHRDYKTSTRDGYRSALTMDTNGATVLVPVTLTCGHGQPKRVQCKACESAS